MSGEAIGRAQGLLGKEDEAWTRMWEQVARIPVDGRRDPGVVGDWSVQDLVWHCAEWADFCGRHLELMRSGSWTDPFAVETDEHWDRVNQDIAERSKTMTWVDVETGAASARERVRIAIASLGTVDDVAAAWFAEETFLHYDEHADQIAAFVDATTT
ncbi:MAG: hypothetical protein ACXVEI_11230 [Actinomycetota bacterium]